MRKNIELYFIKFDPDSGFFGGSDPELVFLKGLYPDLKMADSH